MEDNNSSLQIKKVKKEKIIEGKVINETRSDEMEEFALKVKVDLEEALSGQSDYLSVLEEAYNQAEKTEKEYETEFREFGLEKPEKRDNIFLISCFLNSGEALYDYPLAKKVFYQESQGLIINTIETYIRYDLGGLIEVLTLEFQSIHFFSVEEKYIVSIVTSKDIPRDKISLLAFQIGQIIDQNPNTNPQDNLELRKLFDRAIALAKASLIQEHHTFKIILIGDGAVGKTSIRRRYLGEGFRSDYQMTIGADLAAKTSETIYTGGRQIKYLIWDLAGQPRFNNVRKVYYMSAVGALVVFDMNRPESFQTIVHWMNELWRNNGLGPVPLIILGNKTDLCDAGLSCVSKEKVQAFVSRMSQITMQYRGFNIHFLLTSAKSGKNIEQAFNLLGEAIVDFLPSLKKHVGKK